MELTVIQVARQIELCIDSLTLLCKKLDGIGEKKVETSLMYDKELAKALVRLKVGEPVPLPDGTIAENIPVSTQEKVAKGICADVAATMLMAEISYKALHTKIECAKAALNGWQSYNRHLDTLTK